MRISYMNSKHSGLILQNLAFFWLTVWPGEHKSCFLLLFGTIVPRVDSNRCNNNICLNGRNFPRTLLQKLSSIRLISSKIFPWDEIMYHLRWERCTYDINRQCINQGLNFLYLMQKYAQPFLTDNSYTCFSTTDFSTFSTQGVLVTARKGSV